MKVAADKIIVVMERRGRKDLASALSHCWLELELRDVGGAIMRVHAPPDEYECLRALTSDDDALFDAFVELYSDCGLGPVRAVSFTLEMGNKHARLIAAIEEQKKLMIDVATGGRPIKEVDDEYKKRRAEIAGMLKSAGIKDPNPFVDLWSWYKRWRSEDLPTYRSRRQFLSELYAPLIDKLSGDNSERVEIFDEPTGWAKVDRTVTEIRERLEQALTEEQFQAVGLLCRDALISLAQAVFDPARHPTIDGVKLSSTDFKRMIEAYIAVELAGQPNETSRRHAKAAFDLANELQHKRTATFRLAALCAEATVSVINLVAIVSGRRDP